MSTFTTSDGVELFYEEHGEGRPLVLIGGWTMSTEWWRRNVPELSKVARVISLDMRSYGRSEKTPRGHRLARHATDLRELILTLDLSGVVPCGWSLGASTIWSHVDLYGTARLAGAVFVDQTPKILTDDGWKTGLGTDFPLGAVEDFLAPISGDPEGFRKGFVPTMFLDPPPADELTWMLDAVNMMPAEHAVEVLRDHLTQDWRDVLDRVDVPALVVTGAHSSLFPPESGSYQAERMPNARWELFENSSHLPFYEEPDRFNAAVGDFVRSL